MEKDPLLVRIFDKLYFKTIVVWFLMTIVLYIIIGPLFFLITSFIVAIVIATTRKEKYLFWHSVGSFIYSFIFTIPLLIISLPIWVMDTVSGTHLADGL